MNRNKGSVPGLFRWVGAGVLVFVAGTPAALGQAHSNRNVGLNSRMPRKLHTTRRSRRL